MIKIVADIGKENSTMVDEDVPTILVTEDSSEQDASNINSVPIMAIFLALIASCNSGKGFLQTASR